MVGSSPGGRTVGASVASGVLAVGAGVSSGGDVGLGVGKGSSVADLNAVGPLGNSVADLSAENAAYSSSRACIMLPPPFFLVFMPFGFGLDLALFESIILPEFMLLLSIILLLSFVLPEFMLAFIVPIMLFGSIIFLAFILIELIVDIPDLRRLLSSLRFPCRPPLMPTLAATSLASNTRAVNKNISPTALRWNMVECSGCNDSDEWVFVMKSFLRISIVQDVCPKATKSWRCSIRMCLCDFWRRGFNSGESTRLMKKYVLVFRRDSTKL
ncbi:expressed unknown protein [Seminavis robusta]|uniref:Uncharacterized protein n=1 Tax=Seminavis robusta TaxID=568900 RepID=A0A9N8EJQ8_9STRA|nr:expressed unknown protein [Seminavis robusta]|eukprot:Sro1069_g237600.1 n/a (270) ;mRNA; f:19479-20288